MDLMVRYAKFDELPRVNELRRAVSELHAEGRRCRKSPLSNT